MKASKLLIVISLLLAVPMAASETDQKVMVIGLDGAEWDVIRPLMERGEMPNLEKLVEEGKHGNLTTTLPVESPVAWSSMTTGKTPGKHGIYGFLERRDGSFVPTTARDVRSERVWDHAGEEGEVVVMNVPQTFPPSRVNGSLVSGYLSIKDQGYTYPESLQSRLESKGYSIEAMKSGYDESREEEFLEKLNGTVESRTRSAEMLLNESDWKLGFVTFTGLDRLQHYYWNYRDGGKHEGVIDEHYRELDSQIGRLMEHRDENTTVVIVSDHGFGPLNKNIYLNTWLRQEGYLSLESAETRKGWMSKTGLTQQNLVDTLSGLGLMEFAEKMASLVGFNPGKSLPDPGLSDIDFGKTEAYAGNYGGKIYLTENAENREETLDEIEEKLKAIEDPETGEEVVEEVHRPEDIYTGSMEGSPDLIIEPEDSYRSVGFLGHSEVVKKPPQKTGTHRRDGIYVISSGEGAEDAEITDIAPTVLDALDMEVPEDMDGKSLMDG